MRKYFQSLTKVPLMLVIFSPNLPAAELVTEFNIRQIQGTLYISLYKDVQGFNANNNFVKREKVSVDKNTIHVKFADLPAGEYALKAYQDVNDNGKLDFNGMIPAEPFGSSSKSKELTPPDFTDAKFTLNKNLKLQIQLLE